MWGIFPGIERPHPFRLGTLYGKLEVLLRVLKEAIEGGGPGGAWSDRGREVMVLAAETSKGPRNPLSNR